MSKVKPIWIVLGVILLIMLLIAVVIVVSVIGSYNNLVTANENIDGKWSQIETNLQRRADLIPNLVETVKGYAAQEKEIFTAIAEARSKLIGASGVEEAAAANNELSSALSRLLAISEAYPNLKSDANFRQLMDELAGTENRIARARQEYNDSVQAYNTRVKRFPTSLVAGIFGFSPREYFEADEGSKVVPKVNF
ncbi:LemA family protein [Petroclostridium sp. X23]|uniref:LemA family protein n=1 Tax=Petroclostridium sp. X23 TaxID=3045146 RepID=UPI0024AC9A73|nr:LemA family protein [Petroclostridium sp. X23]WHH56988.1 LemA family protein [Petroclostridium sp. X23]